MNHRMKVAIRASKRKTSKIINNDTLINTSSFVDPFSTRAGGAWRSLCVAANAFSLRCMACICKACLRILHESKGPAMATSSGPFSYSTLTLTHACFVAIGQCISKHLQSMSRSDQGKVGVNECERRAAPLDESTRPWAWDSPPGQVPSQVQ